MNEELRMKNEERKPTARIRSHSFQILRFWFFILRSRRKLGDEVNLSCDFAESKRCVELLADRVLHERFDLGVSEASVAKTLQRKFDELTVQA